MTENLRIPLTGLQTAFLDDLDVSGSETYAETVAAGLLMPAAVSRWRSKR